MACCMAFLLSALSISCIAEAVNVQAETVLKKLLEEKENTHKAKNIILFVGDGMGVSTVTAARILAGQQLGLAGEEYQLSFEQMPYTGLSKTYNTNQQTPDSAGTMTAMMTGWKTKAGFLSVNEQLQRGDCASKKHNLDTLLEQFEQVGRATGIVTTARVTHATAAATYAHSAERNWEGDSDIPEALKKQGCKDVAAQLIDFNVGDGIEVVMGGGRKNFLPKKTNSLGGKNVVGARKDGRNLIVEWQNKYTNTRYLWNKEQLDSINVEEKSHVLGLFNDSHMSFDSERKNTFIDEPSLTQMTEKAIQILSHHQQGYFLMIEGGRIDHGHHAGNAYKALTETIEFSNAVEKAMSMVNQKETLIIVTADHSHAMTIAGYPTRGNPILGKVIVNDKKGNPRLEPYLADDGLAFTAISYANGSGAKISREKINTEDTQAPNYRQQALIPLGSETHGAEDVAIYATGPWAHLIRGSQEQNMIYYVMKHAAQL